MLGPIPRLQQLHLGVQPAPETLQPKSTQGHKVTSAPVHRRALRIKFNTTKNCAGQFDHSNNSNSNNLDNNDNHHRQHQHNHHRGGHAYVFSCGVVVLRAYSAQFLDSRTARVQSPCRAKEYGCLAVGATLVSSTNAPSLCCNAILSPLCRFRM